MTERRDTQSAETTHSVWEGRPILLYGTRRCVPL